MIIFMSSCEKELDFKYHDVESQLVIEGLLNSDGCKVTLSMTTPMNEKIETDYLTDAEVRLTEIESEEIIELRPDNEGIFTAQYIPAIGNNYQINVIRNDKEYFSDCMMRKAPVILGLLFQWIKMPYDHVAVLQITFEDFSNEGDCYWIKIYRNDEPYKWIISDDRGAVNGVITEVIMTTRMDLDEEDEKDILKDGDVVQVSINTISREMYDYLTAISNDSNGPAMFEGDFCLGYFMASDSSTDSVVFHPDEITYY